MMSDEITFKMQMVTAEMALQWLEKNNGNRSISRTDVSRLKETLRRGEWRLVHQAIAFDGNGNLIDGQHRLTAIAETGIPAMLYVARYATLATAKGMPFDIGRKRTVAQVLQQDPKATQVINVLHDLFFGRGGARISLMIMNASIDRHAELLRQIDDATRKNQKSPAPIRAGALLAMIDHTNHDSLGVSDILQQLWAFGHSEYDNMWSSVRCLNKQWETGTINGGGRSTGSEATEHRAARSYLAFLPSNRHSQAIRCVDPRLIVRPAIERIGQHVLFPESNQ
jgi:hypothetical protein